MRSSISRSQSSGILMAITFIAFMGHHREYCNTDKRKVLRLTVKPIVDSCGVKDGFHDMAEAFAALPIIFSAIIRG